MRVSSNMLTRQAILNIEKSYEKLATAHSQSSSGKRYQKSSDNPVNYSLVSSLKFEKQEIEKFYSNINNSRTVVNDTEIALKDINEAMHRIKELASASRNSALSFDNRKSMALEMSQLKDHIVSALNSTSAGQYIFGGFNTKSSPVKENGGNMEFNNVDIATMTAAQKDDFLSENVKVNISKNVTFDLKVSALEITGIGDDNLLNTIDKVVDQLNSATVDYTVIDDNVKKLEGHYDNVLFNLTKIGSSSKRLDTIEEQLKTKEAAVKSKISDYEDIDVEEAILNYKLSEQAYNATLAMSGKTIQLSLIDYLR